MANNEPIREVVVNGNSYPLEADTSELKQQIEELNNDLTKKSLVNTYYDSSVSKLYQVNADGTKGSEIPMGGVKRIFRGKKTLSADVTNTPATVSITLSHTVEPSKCHVTLYGNGASTSSYDVNGGLYVDSLTSTTLTVGFALSGRALHRETIIGYEIVEYN